MNAMNMKRNLAEALETQRRDIRHKTPRDIRNIEKMQCPWDARLTKI